ncbi:MAG: anti-sigma factor [Acidimicrobiia bacterium]|nr:anti-sigma factor [Acidimicrobiia bacterium]
MIHEAVAEMIELYALHALEADEERWVESHLEGCDECEFKLAAALTTTAAFVEDSAPPNHVWDQIVREIEPESPVRMETRRQWWVKPLAAAAAVAVVVSGGLWLTGGSSSADPLVAAAAAAAAEPDSIVASFTVDDVHVAQVVLTSAGLGYVIPADGLPVLEETRTYQLWVINAAGEAVSGGVLGHDPGVSAFTWTDDLSGFALTREVAGGVPVSAGDVVAVVTDL